MLGQRHFRRPVGRQDEHAHVGKSAGQVVQDVDRRDIGPVQVVEEEDDRSRPRDVLEVGADLALHALLRGGQRLDAQVCQRRFLDRPRRHLQVPGRSHRLHQGLEGLAAGPVQQAVERFENGQIRFGACQPLGAAAARDNRPLRARRQLDEDVLDEAGLADAGLARDANDQALTVLYARIDPPQIGPFALTANGLAYAGRLRARRLERGLASKQGGQLFVDFAGRRPAIGFLGKHPMHQRVERRGNRGVEPDERHRLLGENRRQHGGAGWCHERPAARRQLVQHHAEREDV